MKKIILLISVFLLAIASVSSLIGYVYPDRVRTGETAEMIVTFFNHGESKEKDLQASIFIPDLDFYDRGREFDLKSGSSGKSHFLVDIPKDAEPDFYPVIIMLEGDNGQYEKKHSWLEIYR